jgi:hypothetical protein
VHACRGLQLAVAGSACTHNAHTVHAPYLEDVLRKPLLCQCQRSAAPAAAAGAGCIKLYQQTAPRPPLLLFL